ncbi:MAG: cytochrome c maturation protein CcmE [Pseudomonadota bacterium]
MTPRKQRLLGVLLVVAGVAVATVFSLSAFEDSMMFYIELDDVVAGDVPKDKDFRIGGLVTEGSLRRAPGDIALSFTLNDLEHSVDVSYSGVLPDLFREGQGIIAHGRLNPQGVFEAHTVLAKHDENYMPPEVAESLKGKLDGVSPEL